MWDMQIHSVRLPDELVERLRKVADREDRSVSYIVRRALEQYLAPLPRPSNPVGFVIEKGVLEAPAPSRERIAKLDAEDRARALEAQCEEMARQVTPEPPKEMPERFRPVPRVPEIALYTCPEDRCPYASTRPGTCVHHRTRRLVKA